MRSIHGIGVLCLALIVSVTQANEALPGLPFVLRTVIARSHLSPEAYGLEVYDVEQKKVVLSYNARTFFRPASVMKTVTMAAAFDILGLQHRWHTMFFLDPLPVTHGVYRGNLYVRAVGSPQLMFEDLIDVAEAMHDRGIRVIKGDIVVDSTQLGHDGRDYTSYHSDDLVSSPYNVGPHALLLNYRTLEFAITAHTARARVIHIEPKTIVPSGCVVHNHLRFTLRRRCDITLHVQQQGPLCQLVFSGRMNRSCFAHHRSWSAYTALFGHVEFFQRSFQRIWHELGGEFHGRVREGVIPAQASSLVTEESPPFSEIAYDTLKYSNNVMAQLSFLHLGSTAYAGALSTHENAQVVMAQWLARYHLCAQQLPVIDNGSGFSYTAAVTPACVRSILAHVYETPSYEIFKTSLPLVGVDGTMKARLMDDPVAGHAFVKTGTMKTVRAIAGYVQSRRHRTYIVVGFVNAKRATEGLPILDTLLSQVYEL